jgi:hypothetical protein
MCLPWILLWIIFKQTTTNTRAFVSHGFGRQRPSAQGVLRQQTAAGHQTNLHLGRFEKG